MCVCVFVYIHTKTKINRKVMHAKILHLLTIPGIISLKKRIV